LNIFANFDERFFLSLLILRKGLSWVKHAKDNNVYLKEQCRGTSPVYMLSEEQLV